MPEERENTAIWFYLMFLFIRLFSPANSHLFAIWADATSKPGEAKLAPDGHVYELEPSSTAVRGVHRAQTALYPPAFQKTTSNPNPRPLNDLQLVDIHYTARATIFQFQNTFDSSPIYLKVAYLTHTSVQIYTKSTWNSSIRAVSKEERGFRIGMALEFRDYVIAFVSVDNVFQPTWSSQFPETPPDVYFDFPGFLERVANWISERAKSCVRNKLAIEVIREHNKVWHGVGVYTSSEIFNDAGLCGSLTETEVFDYPSRTAALCEAFWSFSHKSWSDMMQLIHPCIREDGVLAPTITQRLKYKNWLHVYAKHRVELTARQKRLLDNYMAGLQAHIDEQNRAETERQEQIRYWQGLRDAANPSSTGRSVRRHRRKPTPEEEENKIPEDLNDLPLPSWFSPWIRDEQPLCDVFEPEYIRAALDPPDEIWQKKKITLGPLIFGEAHWKALGGRENLVEDPLTQSFKQRGLLDRRTTLDMSEYTNLFISPGPSRVTTSHAPTFCYQGDKQIWSVLPTFPSTSLPSRDAQRHDSWNLTELIGTEQNRRLFDYIVEKTKDVSIGPLEYCGNARAFKGPGGKIVVCHVFYDPQVSPTMALRDKMAVERRTIRQTGKAKTGVGASWKESTETWRSIISSIHLSKCARPRCIWCSPSSQPSAVSNQTALVETTNVPATASLVELPPFKKRRISQDKALAIQGDNFQGEHSNPQTRRRHR